MSIFINTVGSKCREKTLLDSIKSLSLGMAQENCHIVNTDEFKTIPGTPYSYWVSSNVRNLYSKLQPLLSESRLAQHGCSTKDDFRYLRLNWELPELESSDKWYHFAKGGEYSQFYSDIHLCLNWGDDAYELEADLLTKYPYLGSDANWVLHRECYYLKEGLTWSRRTTSGLGMRVLPSNCFFSDKGPAIFAIEQSKDYQLALLALMTSNAFKYLLGMQLAASDTAARSYEIGLLQNTPLPELNDSDVVYLSQKARESWYARKLMDSSNEISHAFILPKILLGRLVNDAFIEKINEYNLLQEQINKYCYGLYGFSKTDILDAERESSTHSIMPFWEAGMCDENRSIDPIVSWAIGVVFGRFDIRLSTGERGLELEVDPDPFAPLPHFSPGMLASNSAVEAPAILTTDKDEPGNIYREVHRVLERVGISITQDLEKYIDKSFFKKHLSDYSKSRRQAPIYWPLQSLSGSCTLWVYSPRVSSQTIYECINDFVEPKLSNLSGGIATLKLISTRSPVEEKEYSSLVELESELHDFKHELMQVAKFWQPNSEDGVQINASPLWRLFQNKPWQKKLKQTWEKLEDGDYDWAHLAYTTWPERVLKKCHIDRSIAIAHGVESDLWHEVEVLNGKKKEPVWEWQSKPLSPAELNDYVREKIATDERLALYRSNAKNSGVKK
jgi:hypothetical protein